MPDECAGRLRTWLTEFSQKFPYDNGCSVSLSSYACSWRAIQAPCPPLAGYSSSALRWQRDSAARLGIQGARGAVSFPQRFGGSLNLNVHYHVAVPDGVFTFARDDAPATFHPLPAPDRAELQDIASDVAIRTLTWLRRRDLLRDEPDETDSTEQRDRSALGACLEGSLGLGELTALRERHQAEIHDGDALRMPSKSARRGGTDRGFDLHAGVVVSAADREGRERLWRYCARPPLSLERLRVLPDGSVAYALRKRESYRALPRRFPPQ